jgi:hypothetical protein
MDKNILEAGIKNLLKTVVNIPASRLFVRPTLDIARVTREPSHGHKLLYGVMDWTGLLESFNKNIL